MKKRKIEEAKVKGRRMRQKRRRKRKKKKRKRNMSSQKWGRRAFTPTQTGPDMAIGVLADCLTRDYNNSLFFQKAQIVAFLGHSFGKQLAKVPL